MLRRPPTPTFFPYTTLFRSRVYNQILPSLKRTRDRELACRNNCDVVESTYAKYREIKQDRKSTRLNSSHANISYAVFCLKKKIKHLRLDLVLSKYPRSRSAS